MRSNSKNKNILLALATAAGLVLGYRAVVRYTSNSTTSTETVDSTGLYTDVGLAFERDAKREDIESLQKDVSSHVRRVFEAQGEAIPISDANGVSLLIEQVRQLASRQIALLMKPDFEAWRAFADSYQATPTVLYPKTPMYLEDGSFNESFREWWEVAARTTRDCRYSLDRMVLRVQRLDGVDYEWDRPGKMIRSRIEGRYAGDISVDAFIHIIECVVPVRVRVADSAGTVPAQVGLQYAWHGTSRRWYPYQSWIYINDPTLDASVLGHVF